MSKRQVPTIGEPSFSEPHMSSLPVSEALTSPYIMHDLGACILAPGRLSNNWGSRATFFFTPPGPLLSLIRSLAFS